MSAPAAVSTNPNPLHQPLSLSTIIAQNLVIARTVLGWTQHELADASGVSRATIAQLEAGLGDPRLSTLELLAEAMHLSASFFLLDQSDFRSLIELASDTSFLNRLPKHKSLQALEHILQNGRHTSRVDAARLGADAAHEAGLTGIAHTVGAAIGAARFASQGTLLGAHLAYLQHRYKNTKPAPLPPPVPDDHRFSDGL